MNFLRLFCLLPKSLTLFVTLGESDRQNDKEENPPETRENLVKERHDNGKTMEEQARGTTAFSRA